MTKEELRERRMALRLSQAQLAKRLGFPQATVSRWEKGVHGIRHPEVLRLALAGLERELVPG